MNKDSIKVVARTLEVTKTVRKNNLRTGNFSVSQSDLDFVQDSDTVNVNVFDENENAVGNATFSGKTFRSSVTKRTKKYKSGRQTTFFTLPYNKKANGSN